jgi:SWI/SNF-related matrix-associated actin-dependent regulator of chromatin subfamily A-like protein 1
MTTDCPAHCLEVVAKLQKSFGGKAVVVTGDTKLEARAEAVSRFQHDPHCKVFIGSLRTAGQGITLTAASRVLFVEFDWSPMVMNQAEDRCHRIGQASSDCSSLIAPDCS